MCLYLLYSLRRKDLFTGNYKKGSSVSSGGERFQIVDDVIRGLLSDGDGPSESSMRGLLPLVAKIQSIDGNNKSGPVLLLWEYFFKKMNSTFYIPGSKLNTNIVMRYVLRYK